MSASIAAVLPPLHTVVLMCSRTGAANGQRLWPMTTLSIQQRVTAMSAVSSSAELVDMSALQRPGCAVHGKCGGGPRASSMAPSMSFIEDCSVTTFCTSGVYSTEVVVFLYRVCI